jgi:hypothetical protein
MFGILQDLVPLALTYGMKHQSYGDMNTYENIRSIVFEINQFKYLTNVLRAMIWSNTGSLCSSLKINTVSFLS